MLWTLDLHSASDTGERDNKHEAYKYGWDGAGNHSVFTSIPT